MRMCANEGEGERARARDREEEESDSESESESESERQREKERETERQRDKETERQKERVREREREREKEEEDEEERFIQSERDERGERDGGRDGGRGRVCVVGNGGRRSRGRWGAERNCVYAFCVPVRVLLIWLHPQRKQTTRSTISKAGGRDPKKKQEHNLKGWGV